MNLIKRMALVCTALLLGAVSAMAETPTLKAAVLKIGTVNWELDVIKHNELDTKNGFNLEVQGLAGNPATRVAFQGGEVDIVVADWIWVARQRADGKDYVFIPYSTAVGGLMVKKDSGLNSLEDLKGKKIGIAGGPVDKSWLLIQALATQQFGLDLVSETEQVFGAPPLIFKSALSGDVDGAINFWHFGAKMQAAGMTPLVSVAVDDEEWVRIRPRMNAKKDSQFEALKSGFRAGIPASQTVNEADAAELFALMAKLGGEKLVGSATAMPEGVFYSP